VLDLAGSILLAPVSKNHFREPELIYSRLQGDFSMSKDHHADGQHDYRDGTYNPPHTITPIDHFVHSEHTIDELVKDNEEYDSGYSNARNNK
jgi:hypothetical protein